MRTHLALVSTAIILSIASLVGCGSDGDTASDDSTADGKDGKDGKDGSNGSPGANGAGGNGSPGTPGTAGTPGTPGTSGTPGTGTPGTGTPGTGTPGTGTPGTGTPGTGTPGTTPTAPDAVCAADSIKENETNNTPETATAVALTSSSIFCGALTVGDVDHFSFTLPADATGFAYKTAWKGKGTPTISMIVEGVAVDPGTKPPIKPGKVYDFKVEGAADAVDYTISVAVGR